jgi:hypothetical protein
MQERLASLRQLHEGQTAVMVVDEALGAWKVSRLEGGSLVLESPEIPLEPDNKLFLLSTALLENLSGEMLVNGRFSMGEENDLRLQTYTNDIEFHAAVLDLAKVYAQIVHPDTFRSDDDSEVLSLEQLLQEPSFDELSAKEQAYELLASFFKTIESDSELKDCLYIDSSSSTGVIELSEEMAPILLIPEITLGKMDLLYPVHLFSEDEQLEQELELSLRLNSIIRLGSDMTLGCMEDASCLYLKTQLFSGQFNSEGIKDALGMLLSTGEKVATLLGQLSGGVDHSQSNLAYKRDFLSQGGVQI